MITKPDKDMGNLAAQALELAENLAAGREELTASRLDQLAVMAAGLTEAGHPAAAATLARLAQLSYDAEFHTIFLECFPRLQKLAGELKHEGFEERFNALSGAISQILCAGDPGPAECFISSCKSGVFKDWESAEEEDAWRHLE